MTDRKPDPIPFDGRLADCRCCRGSQECPRCDGWGGPEDDPDEDCPECNGSGSCPACCPEELVRFGLLKERDAGRVDVAATPGTARAMVEMARPKMRRIIRESRAAGVPDDEIRAEERVARRLFFRSIAGTSRDLGDIFKESYARACEDAMEEELARC